MRSQTESGNEGQKSLRKAFGEVFNAYHERHFSLVTDEVGNEGYFLALPEKICNLVLSMAEFNWLHLTDLHFSARNQSNLWPNIRESFFQDLTTLHAKTGPWQAILFTGDLVKSGLKEEFDQLNERVLLPLRNHLLELGSQKPVLLAVAGNHDLFRPDDKKPKAALKQLYKTQEFSEFAEEFWTDKDCEYREIVANAFKEFDYWIDNNPFSGESKFDKGLLAGDFTSSLKIEGKNGLMKTIGIAGINTTFLQLKGGDYKGRLAWDMAQLQHACKEDLPSWCRSHDACILMSHQGPEWLNEHSNVEVYPEINPAGRFALHLFGHMHESVLRTSAVGGGLNLRQWQGSSLFSTEKLKVMQLNEGMVIQ